MRTVPTATWAAFAISSALLPPAISLTRRASEEVRLRILFSTSGEGCGLASRLPRMTTLWGPPGAGWLMETVRTINL
ncbi:hypothetical protein M446_2903 [Methylobacterium sp. 4-46]|nr:hypothetical protein M446_2903 [Methylobacterium sp. 4-46]